MVSRTSFDRTTRGRRALIAAGDLELAARTASVLARDGFGIDTVHTGSDALAALGTRECDLLVIGGTLPDVGSLELLHRALLSPRARSSREAPCPAMATMLLLEPSVPDAWPTAQADADVARKIAALTAGADDVLSVPFNDDVLRLRAAALLRRRSRTDDRPRDTIVLGPLRVDLDAVTVASHDRRLELTRSEFRLLRALILRPGTVLSRAELKGALWGEDEHQSARALTVHVSRLRQKLARSGVVIDVLPGRGYRLRHREKSSGANEEESAVD